MNRRFNILVRAFRLMTPREMWAGLAILVVMMLAGLLESAIVALVVPIVYVMVDPAKFTSTGIGKKLVGYLNPTDVESLFVYLAAAMVVLLILTSVVSAVSRYLSGVHNSHCVSRLARELLARCINAPYLWLSRQSASKLANY